MLGEHMKNVLLVFILIFLSAGCSQKQISRQDQLAMINRNKQAATQRYVGFTKDELANAAEKVLYLIDPSDMTVIHQENRVIAMRSYMLFIIFNSLWGSDTWVVDLKKVGEQEYDVSVSALGGQSVGVFATPPQARSPEEISPDFSALSESDMKLFFSRLDYFLKKNATWKTCKDAKKDMNNYIGNFLFICGGETRVGIEDETPSYLNSK